MEKLPAKTGWLWVKEGFALFRKQPAELSTLFLLYIFLMFALGIIPVLGQLLPLVLVPVFSMAFMQACAQVEQGKRVYPNLLLTGFRSPAVRPLLILGVLYLLAAVLAIAASALVDGGAFWNMMSGQAALDPKTTRDANLMLAMLCAAMVYVPAAMAFWYAAPLVAWQDMGVGKSLFYSFFAVRNATRAFLVYGLAWAALGVILPAIVSSFIALLLGTAMVAIVILLPLSLVLTVIMYCSFYSTYKSIFGKPPPQDP
ncbi:MAG TPA: BPSS1780 family membrane protein [Paucimonas sp.]|nr:BPSS1780 family membrane protein [Paucimonas sp.]HJW53900.1 BPSS1780 family membrane protein [Burkholderiaceae bacterium]